MCFSLLLLLSICICTGAKSSHTSITLQHHPKDCFVTQFSTSCNGRRSNQFQLVSPQIHAPSLLFGTSTKQKLQQRQSMIIRGVTTPSNTNNQDTNNNNNSQNNNSPNNNNTNNQQQLIPTLMYTIVPFLPSITIQTLNDHYQQLKQQFNIAAASLPPGSPTTDSSEYIAASTLYNESMQSLLILLLSKRIALYFLATMATLYAGWRASLTIGMIGRGSGGGVVGGPGMALDSLNREVLKGERSVVLDGIMVGDSTDSDVDDDDATVDLSKDSGKEEDDDDNLFATLVDDSPQSAKVGGAIALILPLLLGGSLALSYTLISFFKDVGIASSSIPTSIISDEYMNAIQGLLPYLTSIPSMALCVLFVATEFRLVSTSSTSTNTTSLLRAENIAALLYVVGAYIAKVYPTITIGGEWNLDLGPLQNGVNIAFAATVVRALSPFLISYTSTTADTSSSTSSSSSPKVPSISLQTMALALLGVTMFDGISVFGTVANAATIDTTTAAPTSVMESVATYKVGAQLWNPGLLSVVVGHNQNAKITEALGLGDVVFPACLVAWGFFADATVGKPLDDAAKEVEEEMPKRRQISYATATTAGYVIGSAATEIVGTFSLLGSGRGLPALIFLIPSMLIAVTAAAASRGELNEVWGSGDVAAESNASD